MKLKLATWNCTKGFQTKCGAIAGHKPDIVAIQECADGLYLAKKRANVPQPLGWVGYSDRTNWNRYHDGIAVFSWTGMPATPYQHPNEEATAGIDYALPLRIGGPRPFNLLALWNKKMLVPESERPMSDYVYMIWHTLEVYHEFITEQGRPAVIMGDLNTSAYFEKREQGNVKTHNALVERLAEMGLYSAYHQWPYHGEGRHQLRIHGGEQEMTHNNTSAGPLHVDYCFLPKMWLNNLSGVGVEWLHPRSDHAALIVDLDFAVAGTAA